MNRYKIGLLVVIGFFTLSFVRLEPPSIMDCEIENTSFVGGEKMVFTAYYNWQFIWIPAGEAHFYLKENEDSYEITVKGTTYESYESIFKVNDFFYSKIDKKTLYPTNFVRHIEEGKYRKFDSIAFDQLHKKAYSFVGNTKATIVKKEIPFETCTHDLLSVLYFLRNINVSQYKKGQYIPTSVLFDEEKFPIKVRYEGKEGNKKVKGLGTFKTIKVIPDLVVGEVFKDGDKMKIWVTDDANKLPLYIESPLKIGSAKAILKSYSKLRNPLTSKISK